jgi:predicted phage tail protein
VTRVARSVAIIFALMLAANAAPSGAAVSENYPDTVFADGFESGTLGAWNGLHGNGTASVGAGAAHSGAAGLSFANTPGQYALVVKTLPSEVTDSSTRIWLRVGSSAGVQTVAQARDAGSSGRMWELLYDGGNRRFYFFPFTAAGAMEVVTAPNSAPLNTWMEIEVRYTATFAGGARVYIDGQTQPSWGVDGNFARESNLRTLQLWNDGGNTVDFDDVRVGTTPAGPTFPGTPAGLSGATGDASVTLNWTAPGSDGGSPISGYRITPYIGSTAQTPILTGSTATNAEVTGLTNGTAYTFTVAAVNAIGAGQESPPSDPLIPRATASAPDAPTALSGVAGDRSVTLDWTAPSNDGGRTITEYRITSYVDGVARAPVLTGSAQTRHTVMGLENGTTYTFRASAVNSVGAGPESPATNLLTPSFAGPTDPVFSDGFETGTTSAWNGAVGPGSATVTPAAAHGGNSGLAIVNASGQYAALIKRFESPMIDSVSRFWVRVASSAGVQTVARARDSFSSGQMWELFYDGANRRFYFFPFMATGAMEVVTAPGSAPTNRWMEVQVRYNATFAGGARLYIDGQTQPSWGVSGNFAREHHFATLQLWNDAANTASFDDVSVATAPPPPTPPAAPTGVTGLTGDATVTLNWSAPSDDGRRPITGYRITPYIGSVAQTPVDTGSGATTAEVTGLTNGTAYTFTVAGVNEIGTGPESSPTRRLTPRGVPSTPDAPTGLSGVAGDRSVALSWTEPADDGGRTITEYRITPYVDGVARAPALTGSAQTRHTLMGLENGTTYTFRVSAVNSVGPGAESPPTSTLTPSFAGPTDTVFSDGFESGTLSAWNGAQGNGTASVGAAGAHSGAAGLTFANTSGQYALVVKSLPSEIVDSSTRFWLRVGSSGGVQTVALARDTFSSGRIWELLYDGINRRFFFFPYTATGAMEVVTAPNTVPLSTWMEVQVRYNATLAGGAQLYINGQTQPSWGVSGNFGRERHFKRLQLWNDVANNTHFDDVHVAAAPTDGSTVPVAPTGVSATRGDASATLNWTAPTSNGGRQITDYRITPYIGPVAQTPVRNGSTATTANLTGLSNGTTYTFTVAAVNSIGTGPDSTASNAVTPAAATAPGAPTGVDGRRGDGSVVLDWDAPADTGGSAITGYRITPYIGSTAQPSRVTDSPATEANVTGLTNGTIYSFRVAAINAIGTGPDSAASNEVTPRADTVPDVPTSVTGTARDAAVRLTWSAPSDDGGRPVTSYRIRPYIGSTPQPVVNTGSAATSATVTGLANGTAYTFVVAATNAVGTGADSAPSSSVTPEPTPPNPIVLENQQPGTTSWQFTDYNKAMNHEIEGYASRASVNKGGSIDFMVSLSSSAQYTLDVYRMGWYPNGTNPDGSSCAPSCGGRLMKHIGPLSGSTQPACARVTSTSSPDYGLTECDWDPSYTLDVPTSWTTGNYIVKLRRLDGTQLENYMTFVVRDDGSDAPIVYGLDVTTWQAYNFWAGAGNGNVGINLYGRINDVTNADLPGSRAYTVSFDRPYLVQGETDGAGLFMVWDFPLVRWMESQGYDMTYVTNVEQEANPGLLSGHRVFVNTGHDEYYSDNMRANLTSGIAAGVDMAFFSANNFYYRVTWAPNQSGVPLRRIHTDKGAQTGAATVEWRFVSPPQPENMISGVMLNGMANARPLLVYEPDHWIYEGTGLVKYTGDGTNNVITSGPGQNALPGLIGYEFDSRATSSPSLSSWAAYEPTGVQQLARSFVPASDNGVAAWADTTMYTAPSGATVFAAGTMQWAFGLDDGVNTGFCSCDHSFQNPATKRITKNILDRFTE